MDGKRTFGEVDSVIASVRCVRAIHPTRVRFIRMLKAALILVATCVALVAADQEPADLTNAKAIDQEMRQLKELPDDARPLAIKNVAARIRQQPARYAIALAENLAVDGTEGSGPDILQEIADTILFVLPNAPPQIAGAAYRTLAELARYSGVRVTLNAPEYSAAMRELDVEDQLRRGADFKLNDIEGGEWTLKGLRGKIVLVSFWATWCPPCRREVSDLQTLCARFKERGLVILAISDEDTATLKHFAAEHKLSYPVLLDPGLVARGAFKVTGIPASFVYDRSGKLVAQALTRPNLQRFLEMLGDAGLR